MIIDSESCPQFHFTSTFSSFSIWEPVKLQEYIIICKVWGTFLFSVLEQTLSFLKVQFHNFITFSPKLFFFLSTGSYTFSLNQLHIIVTLMCPYQNRYFWIIKNDFPGEYGSVDNLFLCYIIQTFHVNMPKFTNGCATYYLLFEQMVNSV